MSLSRSINTEVGFTNCGDWLIGGEVSPAESGMQIRGLLSDEQMLVTTVSGGDYQLFIKQQPTPITLQLALYDQAGRIRSAEYEYRFDANTCVRTVHFKQEPP